MRKRKYTKLLLNFYKETLTVEQEYLQKVINATIITRLRISHTLYEQISSGQLTNNPNELLRNLSKEINDHELLNMFFELEMQRSNKIRSKETKKKQGKTSRIEQLEKKFRKAAPHRFEQIKNALEKEAKLRQLPASFSLHKGHCHICKKFFDFSTSRRLKKIIEMEEELFQKTMFELATALAAYASQTNKIHYFDWQSFCYVGFEKKDFESFIDSRSVNLAILSLTPEAGIQEIKTQYKKLAKKHHPDKGGDSEEMRRINAAYSFLIKHTQPI